MVRGQAGCCGIGRTLSWLPAIESFGHSLVGMRSLGVIEMDIVEMGGCCCGCDMISWWAVEATEVLGTQSGGVKDMVSN